MRLFMRYERPRASTCDLRMWVDNEPAGVLRVRQERVDDVQQVLDAGALAMGHEFVEQGSPDFDEEDWER